MKISDTWLQNIKPQAKRFDVTVTNRTGFMVRVHPSGAISFRVRYKRDHKVFVLVLGVYGERGLSLKQAYAMHDQARRELEQGLDPIEECEKRLQEIEKARNERAQAGSVAYIVDQFMHRRIYAERWDKDTNTWVRDADSPIKPRKRPEKALEVIKPNLVDRIGTQIANTVTKKQLVQLLDDIVDRGSPVMANRAYGLFKQCFSFAAAKDLIPASPMAGIEKPGGKEQSRERALTPDEIRIFWTKLDTAVMEPMLKLGLKILLATLQRRGELTQAYWSHINFERAIWSIPSIVAKNELPHEVPLSPLALKLFKELHAITGNHVRVLPHARRKLYPHRCCDEAALSKAMKRNQKHFGIPDFRTHDLRRTGSTGMASLKVPRLHIKKVMNHKVNDIAEVYDRHDYLEQKHDAMSKWGAHIENIIANDDSRVVQFPKKAGTAG